MDGPVNVGPSDASTATSDSHVVTTTIEAQANKTINAIDPCAVGDDNNNLTFKNKEAEIESIGATVPEIVVMTSDTTAAGLNSAKSSISSQGTGNEEENERQSEWRPEIPFGNVSLFAWFLFNYTLKLLNSWSKVRSFRAIFNQQIRIKIKLISV
jgi:hypothetical protein